MTTNKMINKMSDLPCFVVLFNYLMVGCNYGHRFTGMSIAFLWVQIPLVSKVAAGVVYSIEHELMETEMYLAES